MAYNKTGVWLECNNQECSYQWRYTGKMIRATCPSCHLNTIVEFSKVKKI